MFVFEGRDDRLSLLVQRLGHAELEGAPRVELGLGSELASPLRSLLLRLRYTRTSSMTGRGRRSSRHLSEDRNLGRPGECILIELCRSVTARSRTLL